MDVLLIARGGGRGHRRSGQLAELKGEFTPLAENVVIHLSYLNRASTTSNRRSTGDRITDTRHRLSLDHYRR